MDWLALLGRAAMAAIFLWAGWGKLTDPTATIAAFARLHLPVPAAGYVVAVVIELLGGAALLLGFRIREVALALAVWCVLTAAVAHTDFANRAQMINFMKNICMAGGFLQIVAFGGGRFAVSRS
jgi:putative oxidoreductase